MTQLPLISPILLFYKGSGTDHRGRYLKDILAYSFDAIETSHDIIQWVFPLPEASNHSEYAPILSDRDTREFKSDIHLKGQAKLNLIWFTEFLEGTTHWRRSRDHNHLRITRVIRFLTLIGISDTAEGFLDGCIRWMGDSLTNETKRYWEEALKENPSWL